MFEPDDAARFEARLIVKTIEELTGEPEAILILRALQERLDRLTAPTSQAERAQRMLTILDTSLWQNMSNSKLETPTTPKDEDEILGYGPEGV